MTVPPPEIAANRSLLAALVATNFLGMNTPAIAATEAQYAEMWAQDAVAMYGYAGSSAAATVLSPFTSPDQNTDPACVGRPGRRGQPGRRHGSAGNCAKALYRRVPQAMSGEQRRRPRRRPAGHTERPDQRYSSVRQRI